MGNSTLTPGECYRSTQPERIGGAGLGPHERCGTMQNELSALFERESAPVAQWIRAADFGSAGRGFESLRARQPSRLGAIPHLGSRALRRLDGPVDVAVDPLAPDPIDDPIRREHPGHVGLHPRQSHLDRARIGQFVKVAELRRPL